MSWPPMSTLTCAVTTPFLISATVPEMTLRAGIFIDVFLVMGAAGFPVRAFRTVDGMRRWSRQPPLKRTLPSPRTS